MSYVVESKLAVLFDSLNLRVLIDDPSLPVHRAEELRVGTCFAQLVEQKLHRFHRR